jgi:hypothetical protein
VRPRPGGPGLTELAAARVSARQGWCGRDMSRTCVGEAGGSRWHRRGLAGPLFYPHLVPIISRELHKRSAGSFDRPVASLAVPWRPAAWRRVKAVGANRAAVSPAFRGYEAGNVEFESVEPTATRGLPWLMTTLVLWRPKSPTVSSPIRARQVDRSIGLARPAEWPPGSDGAHQLGTRIAGMKSEAHAR